VLLVPRQLLRSGMTGNVPYYGGRLTPAQAYAASHPSAPTLPGVQPEPTALFGRTPVPAAAHPVAPATSTEADSQAALDHLLSSGVITQAEYQQLQLRVRR
jgi:hypothetical protein